MADPGELRSANELLTGFDPRDGLTMDLHLVYALGLQNDDGYTAADAIASIFDFSRIHSKDFNFGVFTGNTAAAAAAAAAAEGPLPNLKILPTVNLLYALAANTAKSLDQRGTIHRLATAFKVSDAVFFPTFVEIFFSGRTFDKGVGSKWSLARSDSTISGLTQEWQESNLSEFAKRTLQKDDQDAILFLVCAFGSVVDQSAHPLSLSIAVEYLEARRKVGKSYSTTDCETSNPGQPYGLESTNSQDVLLALSQDDTRLSPDPAGPVAKFAEDALLFTAIGWALSDTEAHQTFDWCVEQLSRCLHLVKMPEAAAASSSSSSSSKSKPTNGKAQDSDVRVKMHLSPTLGADALETFARRFDLAALVHFDDRRIDLIKMEARHQSQSGIYTRLPWESESTRLVSRARIFKPHPNPLQLFPTALRPNTSALFGQSKSNFPIDKRAVGLVRTFESSALRFGSREQQQRQQGSSSSSNSSSSSIDSAWIQKYHNSRCSSGPSLFSRRVGTTCYLGPQDARITENSTDLLGSLYAMMLCVSANAEYQKCIEKMATAQKGGGSSSSSSSVTESAERATKADSFGREISVGLGALVRLGYYTRIPLPEPEASVIAKWIPFVVLCSGAIFFDYAREKANSAGYADVFSDQNKDLRTLFDRIIDWAISEGEESAAAAGSVSRALITEGDRTKAFFEQSKFSFAYVLAYACVKVGQSIVSLVNATILLALDGSSPEPLGPGGLNKFDKFITKAKEEVQSSKLLLVVQDLASPTLSVAALLRTPGFVEDGDALQGDFDIFDAGTVVLPDQPPGSPKAGLSSEDTLAPAAAAASEGPAVVDQIDPFYGTFTIESLLGDSELILPQSPADDGTFTIESLLEESRPPVLPQSYSAEYQALSDRQNQGLRSPETLLLPEVEEGYTFPIDRTATQPWFAGVQITPRWLADKDDISASGSSSTSNNRRLVDDDRNSRPLGGPWDGAFQSFGPTPAGVPLVGQFDDLGARELTSEEIEAAWNDLSAILDAAGVPAEDRPGDFAPTSSKIAAEIIVNCLRAMFVRPPGAKVVAESSTVVDRVELPGPNGPTMDGLFANHKPYLKAFRNGQILAVYPGRVCVVSDDSSSSSSSSPSSPKGKDYDFFGFPRTPSNYSVSNEVSQYHEFSVVSPTDASQASHSPLVDETSDNSQTSEFLWTSQSASALLHSPSFRRESSPNAFSRQDTPGDLFVECSSSTRFEEGIRAFQDERPFLTNIPAELVDRLPPPSASFVDRPRAGPTALAHFANHFLGLDIEYNGIPGPNAELCSIDRFEERLGKLTERGKALCKKVRDIMNAVKAGRCRFPTDPNSAEFVRLHHLVAPFISVLLVANRDIFHGEQVLVDYGPDWFKSHGGGEIYSPARSLDAVKNRIRRASYHDDDEEAAVFVDSLDVIRDALLASARAACAGRLPRKEKKRQQRQREEVDAIQDAVKLGIRDASTFGALWTKPPGSTSVCVVDSCVPCVLVEHPEDTYPPSPDAVRGTLSAVAISFHKSFEKMTEKSLDKFRLPLGVVTAEGSIIASEGKNTSTSVALIRAVQKRAVLCMKAWEAIYFRILAVGLSERSRPNAFVLHHGEKSGVDPPEGLTTPEQHIAYVAEVLSTDSYSSSPNIGVTLNFPKASVGAKRQKTVVLIPSVRCFRSQNPGGSPPAVFMNVVPSPLDLLRSMREVGKSIPEQVYARIDRDLLDDQFASLSTWCGKASPMFIFEGEGGDGDGDGSEAGVVLSVGTNRGFASETVAAKARAIPLFSFVPRCRPRRSIDEEVFFAKRPEDLFYLDLGTLVNFLVGLENSMLHRPQWDGFVAKEEVKRLVGWTSASPLAGPSSSPICFAKSLIFIVHGGEHEELTSVVRADSSLRTYLPGHNLTIKEIVGGFYDIVSGWKNVPQNLTFPGITACLDPKSPAYEY